MSWEKDTPEWSMYHDSHWGVSKLQIENSTHAFWTYKRDDGTVADTTWIVNNAL
jgi:hypothetical protein